MGHRDERHEGQAHPGRPAADHEAAAIVGEPAEREPLEAPRVALEGTVALTIVQRQAAPAAHAGQDDAEDDPGGDEEDDEEERVGCRHGRAIIAIYHSFLRTIAWPRTGGAAASNPARRNADTSPMNPVHPLKSARSTG